MPAPETSGIAADQKFAPRYLRCPFGRLSLPIPTDCAPLFLETRDFFLPQDQNHENHP
jgi:hypothetical protein